MKDEKTKKGLWDRLTGPSKPKKSPCCDSCGTEEAPEEKNDGAKGSKPPKDKGRPCCG